MTDYSSAPTWVMTVSGALRWIKDAKQFEKSYRKDCTDYDGAMEEYTDIIMECARTLDEINRSKWSTTHPAYKWRKDDKT